MCYFRILISLHCFIICPYDIQSEIKGFWKMEKIISFQGLPLWKLFVIFYADVSVVAVVMCCVINVDFLAWVVKKAVAAKRTGEEYLERAVNLNLVMELVTDA